MDKSEKLIAAWSLYFSNEKIQPVSIENSQFHITENETVFFQSKSNNNNEVLITNAAIYFSNIRWSLSNICKYAIYQYDCKITIASYNDEIYNLKFDDAKEASNIFSRIISMQNYWLYAATNGKDQQNKLLSYAQNGLYNAISHSQIAKDIYLYISLYLLTNTDKVEDIGLPLMEYRVSRGDFDALLKCSLALSSKFDAFKIKNIVKDLINKHHPDNIVFNPDLYNNAQFSALADVISYLSEYSNSTNLKNNIYCGNIRSYEYILNETASMSDSQKREYIAHWVKASSKQFEIARNAIFSHSTIGSEKILTSIDNYGMYCFNYAVLFKNKSIINKYDTLHFPTITQDKTSPLNILFSPLFIAFFINDLETFNYFVTRSDEFTALWKALSAVREQLHTLNYDTSSPAFFPESTKLLSKIKKQQNYIAKLNATQKKNNLSWSKIYEEKQKLVHLKNQYKATLSQEKRKAKENNHIRISQLKDEEQLIIEEIERIKTYYNKKFAEYTSYFKESNDSFINMLLYLYMNPGVFYENAFSSMTSILYCCDIPFIVNTKLYEKFKNINKQKDQQKETDNKNSTRNNQEKESNQSNSNRNYKQEKKQSKSTFKKESKVSDIKKPYGDSWFSPEAHKDLATLKHEYRKLILKYHPDSPEGSAEIFIDIQDERTSIINKLGR